MTSIYLLWVSLHRCRLLNFLIPTKNYARCTYKCWSLYNTCMRAVLLCFIAYFIFPYLFMSTAQTVCLINLLVVPLVQINFLSQIFLNKKGDGPKIAKRLVNVYFALFKVIFIYSLFVLIRSHFYRLCIFLYWN